MASPECLDPCPIIGGFFLRTTELQNNNGFRQTGTETETAVPPSRTARDWNRLSAEDGGGRCRWDDHVNRIACLLEDISLEEALQIAARSLELSLDDSFNISELTRGEERSRRDSCESCFGVVDDDDAASIDSEIRHLPGLQDGLWEELIEVDRLAMISRYQHDDDVSVHQAVPESVEKGSAHDDSDSCDATSVTTANDESTSGEFESSCVVVDIDELSDLSESFDSMDRDPPIDEGQNQPPAPFHLLQRSDLICSSGSGTSLVVACDMLASRAGSQSHFGGIMTMNRESGIVPNWLRSQLEPLPRGSLHEWHRFVPVVGSCGFNNCRGSVLLLSFAGLGPSGEATVE